MFDSTLSTHAHDTFSTEQELVRVDTWMITFADLMALLLAFFVLIFSMSDFDAKSWGDVVTSLSADLVPMATGNPAQKASQAGFVKDPSSSAQTRAGYLKSLATQKFSDEISRGLLAAEVENGAVLLRVRRDGSQTDFDQSLVVPLAGFFETLREPIDIIVTRSSSRSATSSAARIQTLSSGEAVFQQLRQVGFSGDVHIFESASLTAPTQGGLAEIVFSIRTGQ